MILPILRPEDLGEVIKTAWNQCYPERDNRFSKQPEQDQADITRLCHFLAFYLAEVLGEMVEGEVNSLVDILRELKDSPALSDLETGPISEVLANLSQLKTKSLIPGPRMDTNDMPQVRIGQKVMLKDVPNGDFKVMGWIPGKNRFRVVDGQIEKLAELKDLVFIIDEKK